MLQISENNGTEDINLVTPTPVLVFNVEGFHYPHPRVHIH